MVYESVEDFQGLVCTCAKSPMFGAGTRFYIQLKMLPMHPRNSQFRFVTWDNTPFDHSARVVESPALNRRRPCFSFCSFYSAFPLRFPGKNLLDGRYAQFGYTVDNEDLLADVKEGDIIKSAKVISGKENWKESA